MTVPSWVYDGAQSDVEAAAARIGTPAGDDLARNAGALVRDAAALGRSLSGAVDRAASLERLSGAVSSPLGADRAPIGETTSNRVLEASARRTLEATVRTLAAVELARRTALDSYPHRAAALEARDRAFAALDAVLEALGDETDRALADLRLAVFEAIARRVASLPDLTQSTPLAPIPAVVLAYDLYDDLDREDEIVVRNAVRRPGFLPPRPLGLLSR